MTFLPDVYIVLFVFRFRVFGGAEPMQYLEYVILINPIRLGLGKK